MSPSGKISEAMVEAAMETWYAQPTREDDMSLERSIRAVLTAALSVPAPGTGGAEDLSQIGEMLDEGQGDDDGPQILPDFEPGMSILAKVERCLFLLEKRRDVIAAYGDDRLFDATANMADGEIKMTAAEDVLAWLLIEKIGVPDDTNYTPKDAQDTIAAIIDRYHEYERAALSSSPVGEMDADLFWDDENPEESYSDVEDIFDAIGEAATYLKVRRAKSLPDAWVSCVLADEDASDWTITYHENEESARKTVQDGRTALANERGGRT